ncbi:MAG: response regulator [Anaerolineales bacterium]
MSPIRLLIADDSTEFRKSVKLMLGLEPDIEVVALARDGQEAIDLGQRFQPDVAVIDVRMPKVGGIAAIRALAQASPATACMIISYEQEREILRQAMDAGARDYLIKPFTADELINAIRRVAAKSAPGILGQEQPKATSVPAEMIAASPPSSPAAQPVNSPSAGDHEHEQQLVQLAQDYLKTWRMDNEAMRVYDDLVARPSLDPELLTRLAAIFLARRDWKTLRAICDRMEKPTPLK